MSPDPSGAEAADTREPSDPAAAGGGAEAPTGGGAVGHRLFWWALGIAAFVVLVDQGSKWWAEAQLGDGRTIPVIGDLISFVLVYNPGAAFSIGAEYTWIFAILAAVGAVGAVWFAWRVGSVPWAIALGLLLGGALTHLGDRLFRAPGFGRGHVVDFIGYGELFIGNVADIAIFAGAVMIFVLSLLGIGLRGGRAGDA